MTFLTKPSTLEELAALIRLRVNAPKKRKQTEGEVQSSEQKLAIAIAKKIEEARKWRPSRLVLLTHHQHCSCGQDYRSVVGLMLESVHQDSKARRLRKPINLQEIDHLPHSKEELNEDISICPHCLLERELLEALFSPQHDACVQLPMFDHTPQKRACT